MDSTKQLIWLSWIIFSVGLGTLSILLFSALHWAGRHSFIFQLVTLAVGLIPITALTIINQNRMADRKFKTGSGIQQ